MCWCIVVEVFNEIPRMIRTIFENQDIAVVGIRIEATIGYQRGSPSHPMTCNVSSMPLRRDTPVREGRDSCGFQETEFQDIDTDSRTGIDCRLGWAGGHGCCHLLSGGGGGC